MGRFRGGADARKSRRRRIVRTQAVRCRCTGARVSAQAIHPSRRRVRSTPDLTGPRSLGSSHAAGRACGFVCSRLLSLGNAFCVERQGYSYLPGGSTLSLWAVWDCIIRLRRCAAAPNPTGLPSTHPILAVAECVDGPVGTAARVWWVRSYVRKGVFLSRVKERISDKQTNKQTNRASLVCTCSWSW